MWIVCLADNSHEMSSLIFSEKYPLPHKKKKKIKLLSAGIVINTMFSYHIIEKYDDRCSEEIVHPLSNTVYMFDYNRYVILLIFMILLSEI